jgi:hypothetical protein
LLVKKKSFIGSATGAKWLVNFFGGRMENMMIKNEFIIEQLKAAVMSNYVSN